MGNTKQLVLGTRSQFHEIDATDVLIVSFLWQVIIKPVRCIRALALYHPTTCVCKQNYAGFSAYIHATIHKTNDGRDRPRHGRFSFSFYTSDKWCVTRSFNSR